MLNEISKMTFEFFDSVKTSTGLALTTVATSLMSWADVIQTWVGILGALAGGILSVIMIFYWLRKGKREAEKDKLEIAKLKLEFDQLKATNEKNNRATVLAWDGGPVEVGTE